MKVKRWMSSEIGGTTINPIIESIQIDSCVFKNIFLNIFYVDGHSGFLEEVSITFIDKTDPSDPEKQENLSVQTLKIMVP